MSLVGVLGGDAVEASGGTFTFSDANAGTGKTVAVGGVGLTGSDASNYSVVVPGSVVASILRRAITVTADAKSKREGQADPVLTYAVTGGGLVAGDTLTGALAREAGETPGDYAITQGGLAATANYQLTFVGNTLTIEVAPVGAPETPIVEAARQLVGFLTQYAPAAGDSQALVVIDERACEGVEGEKSEGCGA